MRLILTAALSLALGSASVQEETNTDPPKQDEVVTKEDEVPTDPSNEDEGATNEDEVLPTDPSNEDGGPTCPSTECPKPECRIPEEMNPDETKPEGRTLSRDEQKAVGSYKEKVKMNEVAAVKQLDAVKTKVAAMGVDAEFLMNLEAFHKAVAALDVKPEYKLTESTKDLNTKADLKAMGAFVLALNLDSALMKAHGEYLVEKINEANTHAKALVQIVTDQNLEEAMVALPLIAHAVQNFDGGRGRINAVEEAQRRIASIYDKNKSLLDNKMTALNQALDKADKAFLAKPKDSKLKTAKTRAQADVKALPAVDTEGLHMRYNKAILPVCM